MDKDKKDVIKEEEKEFDFLDRIDNSSIEVSNRPFDIEELKKRINRAK